MEKWNTETMGPAPAYRQTMGVPYATENDDGSQTCPRCGESIVSARKDFESYSGREYAAHYLALHAEADGHIQIDGVWYEPVGA